MCCSSYVVLWYSFCKFASKLLFLKGWPALFEITLPPTSSLGTRDAALWLSDELLSVYLKTGLGCWWLMWKNSLVSVIFAKSVHGMNNDSLLFCRMLRRYSVNAVRLFKLPIFLSVCSATWIITFYAELSNEWICTRLKWVIVYVNILIIFTDPGMK